jgi:hypothetical protein
VTFKSCKIAAGPMPETCSRAGEMTAPAARMTSCLQTTLPRGELDDAAY